LAVGLEGIDDILADLEQGFAAAKPFTAADGRSDKPRSASEVAS
jgi:O-acetylhomoserine (thiol)-lyase